MSDYIQNVIGNLGQECGNCGAWRILKPDGPFGFRIIEECPECGDEEFDIYEAEEDGP